MALPSAAQQVSPSGRQIRVVPQVSGNRSPELTRGPGERVTLTADGDLVIEGAQQKTGQSTTLRITRRVHVKPVVDCAVSSTGGSFSYQYRVANIAGAKQWIQVFLVDASSPVSSARAPEFWRVYNIDRSKPAVDRVFFGRDAADKDESRRLVAGSSQDGFVLESIARPGLVRFFFVGHRPLPGEPGHIADESDLDSPEVIISDWLRREINNYLSTEANAVMITAIGPKIQPAVPAAQAIRNELLAALRNPQFAVDLGAIQSLLKHQERAALIAGLKSLQAKATGLRAELYSALARYY